MVALRLPVARLGPLMRDPDSKVRIALAQRLAGDDLAELFDDPDYSVRLAAARRAEPALLLRLIEDPDPSVRREVACRAPGYVLPGMTGDAGPAGSDRGRRAAAGGAPRADGERRRLPRAVRLRGAAAAALLGELVDDADEMVREAALARKTTECA